MEGMLVHRQVAQNVLILVQNKQIIIASGATALAA